MTIVAEGGTTGYLRREGRRMGIGLRSGRGDPTAWQSRGRRSNIDPGAPEGSSVGVCQRQSIGTCSWSPCGSSSQLAHPQHCSCARSDPAPGSVFLAVLAVCRRQARRTVHQREGWPALGRNAPQPCRFAASRMRARICRRGPSGSAGHARTTIARSGSLAAVARPLDRTARMMRPVVCQVRLLYALRPSRISRLIVRSPDDNPGFPPGTA